jgi:tetratricopeptide (TPR) repeat protein
MKSLFFTIFSVVFFNANSQKHHSDNTANDIIQFCNENNLSEADCYNESGYRKLISENWEAALIDFNVAIGLRQDDYIFHINRGYAYYMLGNLDIAMSDFERVLQINPEYYEAYKYIGVIKYDEGDFDSSIYYFKKFLQSDPQNEIVLYNLANSYNIMERYDMAIITYDKVLKINPKNYKALSNRGAAKALNGRVYDACDDFKKAFALGCPDSEELIKLICDRK